MQSLPQFADDPRLFAVASKIIGIFGGTEMAIEGQAFGERESTERDRFYAAASERFIEKLKRLDDMILTIVKAQIAVESAMISFLEAHGKNPNNYFYTGDKISECRKIDHPEVGQDAWELLTLCSHVRNELVHSLNDTKIMDKSNKVRDAYLAVTEDEGQKQGIRDMTDTQMVMSALYHCGSLIVIATLDVEAKNKAKLAG
jgi:hypothetical protein